MTTQRLVGTVLSLFTLAVVVAHLWQGTLSSYDILYGFVFAGLFLSVVVEHPGLKLVQTAVIFVVGVAVLHSGGDGRFVGPVIMSLAYTQVYAYGGSKVLAMFRDLVWYASYFTLLTVVPGTFNTNSISDALLWLCLCFVIHVLVLSGAKDLADKSARLDALEKAQLQQKLEEDRNLITETVKAGVVLADELRRKESCHDTEDKNRG